jgi:hypothetical protein
MPLPRPEPGLVIPYEYLWEDENRRREEWGKKVRPCAIIVAVTGESGEIETVVAPITHREPTPPSEGIEIPRLVKQHLGLDERRSWVIVTDLNVFHWPGIDIWPVPSLPSGAYDYGLLPSKLFERIRTRIVELGSRDAATLHPEQRTKPRPERRSERR